MAVSCPTLAESTGRSSPAAAELAGAGAGTAAGAGAVEGTTGAAGAGGDAGVAVDAGVSEEREGAAGFAP